jgi:hypothetical protein
MGQLPGAIRAQGFPIEPTGRRSEEEKEAAVSALPFSLSGGKAETFWPAIRFIKKDFPPPADEVR